MNNPIEAMLQQAIKVFQTGDLDLSKSILLKILEIEPNEVNTLHMLGVIYKEEKQYDQSLFFLNQALALDGEFSKIHYNKGLLHYERCEYAEAIAHYNLAIKLEDNFQDAWLNKGNALHKLQEYSQAIGEFERVIEANQNDFEAWNYRGISLNELKRYDEALASYEKAVSLNPLYHEAWSNRGVTLNELKRYEEALKSYEHSISLKPDYHVAIYNKGIALNKLKRYDEALAAYDKAIGLKPDYFDAHWNKSLNQLLTGNLKDGLKNYEYRWARSNADSKRHQQFPALTNTRELSGKRVLVWCEQGYGDTIQFCRFINKLIELKADVIFEVQEPLKELLRHSFSDSHVIKLGEPFGNIDYQIPLLSLPLLFDTNLTNIPNAQPYVQATQEGLGNWKNRLKKNNQKINIGIACSGNENVFNGKNRSIDLSLFQPIASQANLFLIQKDLKESDHSFLKTQPGIKFLGNEIKSFDDSASIVQEMDVIITIDTSLAHLSGALGKPTFLLLPMNPDWRWLLNHDCSPWYPTIRIFRQHTPDKWERLIEEVASELELGTHGKQFKPSPLFL